MLGKQLSYVPSTDFFFFLNKVWDGKMALRLRALIAFPENLGSLPRTHIVAITITPGLGQI